MRPLSFLFVVIILRNTLALKSRVTARLCDNAWRNYFTTRVNHVTSVYFIWIFNTRVIINSYETRTNRKLVSLYRNARLSRSGVIITHSPNSIPFPTPLHESSYCASKIYFNRCFFFFFVTLFRVRYSIQYKRLKVFFRKKKCIKY